MTKDYKDQEATTDETGKIALVRSMALQGKAGAAIETIGFNPCRSATMGMIVRSKVQITEADSNGTVLIPRYPYQN